MEGIRCSLFVARCLVFGVRCSVFGVWFSVFGVRCSLFVTRCLVFGVWCSVYGVDCWVLGFFLCFGPWSLVFGHGFGFLVFESSTFSHSEKHFVQNHNAIHKHSACVPRREPLYSLNLV